MRAILVRIAIDHSFGKWNGPVAESRDFVYVPIPESAGTFFHSGLERSYQEMLPILNRFSTQIGENHLGSVTLPQALYDRAMHLDPDFENLTYGDDGDRRGKEIATMGRGDIIAFYGGLRPTYRCEHTLVYALLGLFIVDEVVRASEVPLNRFGENAHTRKTAPGVSDIVVRAQPGVSGRLERCIPIGEYREDAYRVCRHLLDEWGGLNVKDGYIQRSIRPPSFLDAERFYNWFKQQKVGLIRGNN